MEKNTAQLWDQLWEEDSVLAEKDIYDLAKEENDIRWQRIEKKVVEKFGSFKALKVIEIGAGRGINAALMAKRGAEVTILDYSETALKRSKIFFERNGVQAEYVNANALSLSPDLINKFDISISFGVTEHFLGEERIQIHRAHIDVLKKGGITFISVPNKYNFPYRVYKLAGEIFGFWKVGEEYPFSRSELRKICSEIGVKNFSFFGDSFPGSFHYFNLYKIPRKIFKLKRNLDVKSIKRERGTILDQYLSYSLILCAEK